MVLPMEERDSSTLQQFSRRGWEKVVNAAVLFGVAQLLHTAAVLFKGGARCLALHAALL